MTASIASLGATAIDRFPAGRSTIEAFVGELERAASGGDREELVALLLRFEDYLEALLVAPR